MNNGIVHDLPHAEYLKIDWVSNSYLGRLRSCPAAAKIQQEETPALLFGKALHCYVLDGPAVFEKNVIIEPTVDKRTRDGKAAYASFLEKTGGKAIITSSDMDAIKSMQAAVMSHPMAKELIGTGTHEVSVFWTDPFSGLDCKARPDMVPCSNVLVDLKTTTDASPEAFSRSVLKFGYARQAAFYIDGMNNVTKENFDVFAFIAVEKEPPYRVEVYTLSQDFINYGRNDYRFLINIERQCREKGEWPHYENAGAVEIDLPGWVR